MDWFKFSEHQELKNFFAMLAPPWMVLHCQELVFPFQKGATSQDLSEDKPQLPLGELITCKLGTLFYLPQWGHTMKMRIFHLTAILVNKKPDFRWPCSPYAARTAASTRKWHGWLNPHVFLFVGRPHLSISYVPVLLFQTSMLKPWWNPLKASSACGVIGHAQSRAAVEAVPHHEIRGSSPGGGNE
jgi:hypothetical protein